MKILKKLFEKLLSSKRPNLPFQEGYWLRATPVELHVDHKAAYLIGSNHLNLTETEVTELAQALNDFLKPDHMQIHIVSPDDWYLQSREPIMINLGAPSKLLGKEVSYLFKSMTSGQKLFTELQMFLYQNPVNQQRAVEGKSQITALWLWK